MAATFNEKTHIPLNLAFAIATRLVASYYAPLFSISSLNKEHERSWFNLLATLCCRPVAAGIKPNTYHIMHI
jgi:hypothetical protein